MGEIPRQEEGQAPVEQPCWDMIRKLQQESEFKRSDADSANCEIEVEGRKYRIEVVEDGESPKLGKVQELFERTFGEEEVDPEEILRTSVDGKNPWGGPDVKYRIVTVWDEQGELVSTVAGAQLDLLSEDKQPTGEAVYFVGYAVTDKSSRQKGLAKEAYISALIDASREAGSEGKTLKFAFGECTATSEDFWNKVGWKRIYAETGKKEYTELPYVQPALDFNEETGAVAEGAGEAPEHVMIDSFGRMPPAKQDVASAYEAMLKYCVEWPRDGFSSDEAFAAQRQYVGGIKKEFHDFLNENGQLIYLDKRNRAKAGKEGLKINEYAVENGGDTGKEDF